MSKNRLDDESFGPNSLLVSFFFFIGHCMAVLLVLVPPDITCVGNWEKTGGIKMLSFSLKGIRMDGLENSQWKSDDNVVKLERPD